MNNKILYSLMVMFTSISASMYMIVVGWVLYDISGNAFYSGMLIGVGFIPGLLLNMFFGVMVDRLDRKKISIIGLCISSFVFFLFMMTAYGNLLQVWLIFMFHLLLQTVHSMNRPAIQSLLVQLFSKKDYARVIGASTSLGEFGRVTGASISGFLLLFLDIPTILFIIFLVSLLSISCLSLIRVEEGHAMAPGKQVQPVLFDLKDGFTYLKENKIVLYIILIGFIGQLTLHSNTGLLPVYTTSHLQASSKIFGLLEGTFSISAIIAGLIASWALIKYKTLTTTYALLLIMIGLCILSFTQEVNAAFVGIFFIGLGTTLLRVSTQSLQQMLTDPRYHGRMASFRMLINQGSVVIGSPLLGLISEHFGANRGYSAILLPLVILVIASIFVLKGEITQQKISHALHS